VKGDFADAFVIEFVCHVGSLNSEVSGEVSAVTEKDLLVLEQTN
jgi:hypothetical protein